MRTLLIALFLVGCHRAGTADDFDAGVGGGGPVIGEQQTGGCLQLEACVADCATHPSADVGGACASRCTQEVQALATDLFNVAITCAEKYCEGSDADLPYRCTLVDGAPAEDDGTTPDPAKPCGQCLGDAQSILSGQPCSSTGSPACSSTQGSAAASACGLAETRCVND